MSGYLNLYDLIEGRSQSTQKIISFYENYELTAEKSFADIHQDVIAMTKVLSSQLVNNEIYFVSLPNSYEFIVVFLASLKCGVLPAPIVSSDSLMKSDYLDYIDQMRAHTQINKILAPEASRTELLKMGFEFISMSDLKPTVSEGANRNNPQKPKMLPAHLNDQIAFIQFSSGSTSEPKGVIISHKALIENITMIRLSLELNEKSVIVSWIPFYHDMGLVGSLLTALLTPYPSHIVRPVDFIKSPEKFVELSSKVKATVWDGPDSMYRIIARALSQKKMDIDLSSLKVCLCGAEPILVETFAQFQKVAEPFGWNPASFVAAYGQAENVLKISFSSIRSRIKSYEKNKRQVVSCGKPSHDVKVQILDENHNLMKDGIEGMIWIQSPSLCSGFLDREDTFKSLFLGTWFFTGDMGFLKEGELYVSGRFKDMIIVDSKKFYSVDLEQRIWNLIGHSKHVKKVAVVGKGGIGAEESISVCIEWMDIFPLLTFRLRNEFRNKIIHNFKNQFKIGHEDILFVGIGSFPRTTSGKLKRYEIKNKISKKIVRNSMWNVFWRTCIFGMLK